MNTYSRSRRCQPSDPPNGSSRIRRPQGRRPIQGKARQLLLLRRVAQRLAPCPSASRDAPRQRSNLPEPPVPFQHQGPSREPTLLHGTDPVLRRVAPQCPHRRTRRVQSQQVKWTLTRRARFQVAVVWAHSPAQAEWHLVPGAVSGWEGEGPAFLGRLSGPHREWTRLTVLSLLLPSRPVARNTRLRHCVTVTRGLAGSPAARTPHGARALSALSRCFCCSIVLAK